MCLDSTLNKHHAHQEVATCTKPIICRQGILQPTVVHIQGAGTYLAVGWGMPNLHIIGPVD